MTGHRGVSVEATSDFADLVYHALAFLDVPGPSSSFAPRYIDFARRTLPPDATRWVEDDALLLQRLYAGEPQAVLLHALPDLHASIQGFRASASRELATLTNDEVDDPSLLARLGRLAPSLVEIFRADLALTAPAFAAAYTTALRPALDAAALEARPSLDIMAARFAPLDGARVELTTALGPRGRGLARRIVVGAPLRWNGLAPETSAVLAVHEAAVRDAHQRGEPGYARAEWDALRAGAAAFDGAPTALATAHRDWLATLDLRPLLTELVSLRVVDMSCADDLLSEPLDRARHL